MTENKTDKTLQFFTFEHLPEHLKLISEPFCRVAQWMVNELPDNRERAKGLDKLLEAKDCAVRAKLYKE